VKIAICDDDSTELENIKSAVDEFIVSKQPNSQITVDVFTNGSDLLCYLNKHNDYDLLILDIIMPDMNGIALAAEIRNINISCKIIFLTSSPEFAVNSYKVNAFCYLLKPFSRDEINSLLNKALDDTEEEKSKSIVVKENGRLTRVQIHMIQYIESIRHIVIFHLRDNRVISCYSTMKEFHDILLSDNRFIKCHQSFIVNMNHVISITKNDFVLVDKTLIPISRQIHQQVKNKYIDYFFEKVSGTL